MRAFSDDFASFTSCKAEKFNSSVSSAKKKLSLNRTEIDVAARYEKELGIHTRRVFAHASDHDLGLVFNTFFFLKKKNLF